MIGALRSTLIALAGALFVTGAAAEVSRQVLSFTDLDGWERDDHAEALRAFTETCPDLDRGT